MAKTKIECADLICCNCGGKVKSPNQPHSWFDCAREQGLIKVDKVALVGKLYKGCQEK